MVRIPSTSGLFGPLHPESSPANPFTYGTSFPLSNPGWQTTSGATQDIARISNPSSPAWFDEQPTSTNVALRPWPDQRVFQRLSAPQVTAAAPAPTAPPAANATDARASAATLNGKPPDPDYDRRYAQIIASDPDLSTAVRMAENAGDKTFKDWLTTVLRNLEHNPAAAFEAIRQAAFTNQMRAQTRGTGADVIANLAARKAADRLEALNPGLGVEQARDQGFRAAIDLSQEQRRTLYTITSNPNLSASEKLDRIARAGLFDVALASAITGIGGFAARGPLRGPADRPGGGSGSRFPRASPLGTVQYVDGSGRPSSAEAVVQANRANALRRTSGAISGNGAKVSEQWLANMDAPVPAQVAALLRGQKVRDMEHFRELFWKAVANVPELAAQFTPQNRGLMRRGLAPKAPLDQQMPGHPMFHLHHEKQLVDGGPAYDLDNIRVISPVRHYQIPTIRLPRNRGE